MRNRAGDVAVMESLPLIVFGFAIIFSRIVGELGYRKLNDEEKLRLMDGFSKNRMYSMLILFATMGCMWFVLTQTQVERTLDAQPEASKYGERVAFFDFAAGGDENVFALREGNSVRVVDAWRDSNTVQAVRRFMARARELNVRPHECWGDADGLGLPMVQQFHDEGFSLNSFRGGLPAAEREEYSNLISEVWIQGARKIERGQVHLGELDSVSFTQLTGRFLQWDERGRLRVERKADMARRGVGSPDRADALLGALMCGPHMAGSLTGGVAEAGVMAGSDFATQAVRF